MFLRFVLCENISGATTPCATKKAVTEAAAAVEVKPARHPRFLTSAGVRLSSQAETGECHTSHADAKFLQRPAARNGLGHVFG